MSKIDDVIIDAHNAAPMGYGIWATEIKSWLMESKDHIASWVTEKDADVYRRNHLVSSKDFSSFCRFPNLWPCRP